MNTTQIEIMGGDLITIEQTVNRISKGFKLADQVEILDESTARAYSQYDKSKSYIVDFVNSTCTCPDYIFRKMVCKHIVAVRVVLNLERCEN